MNIRNQHTRLHNNLRLLQKVYSVKVLADVIGVTSNTWCSRMKEPWRLFSIDDFIMIATYCNVDFIDIINGEIKLGV